MGVHEVGIQRQGLLHGEAGLGEGFIRRHELQQRQCGVRIRQAGVSFDVVGVGAQGGLKECDGLAQIRLRAFVPLLATAQIVHIGLGAARRGAGFDGRPFGQDVLAQRLGHLPGDVTLDGEDVPQLTVVGLGPAGFLAGRVDQLDRDTYAVARLAHTAFQHAARAEFAANLRDGFAAAFVAHHRGAGDDVKAAGLRDHGDQLLGHAVGKVLIG